MISAGPFLLIGYAQYASEKKLVNVSHKLKLEHRVRLTQYHPEKGRL